MTLRVRLVAALSVLLAFGLATFGIGTSSAYARSQYERLDDQLRSTLPLVSRQLREEANLENRDGPDGAGPTQNGSPGGNGGSRSGPTPTVVVPPGTYGELRDAEGSVLSRVRLSDTTSVPELPDNLPLGRARTVDSLEGSVQWRVLTARADAPQGGLVVIATSTAEVASSVRRLWLIETIAGLVLLTLLSIGSWLILRRGLRPLESMAAQAGSISAGDLSQRVSPADRRGEVGQLGAALNSMLGELESAFAERRATEDRLRQFLADASHELRTPLTSIRGFAELFRLGSTQPAGSGQLLDQSVVIRRIEEESERMAHLVEDLLLLARLDRTRAAEREPVDLAVLAADACTDAVAMEPARPVTLTAPVPVVVEGDRDHLRQAIANLVTNALRHTPAGTPVEVAACLEHGTAVLTVRDHGNGLDDEALAHVFDRFWQADRARVGGGSGLGLSIVAAIAAEHAGAATVENDPAGGARFTVRLPLPG